MKTLQRHSFRKIAFLYLLLILLLGNNLSCRKDEINEPITAESLSKDDSFIKLNNSIDRFDPSFLKIVFGEKRTISEILSYSAEMLKRITLNENDLDAKSKIIQLYRFSSYQDFLNHSQSLTNNIIQLNQRINFTENLSTPWFSNICAEARKLYAINKIKKNALQDNLISKKQTASLWEYHWEQEFWNAGLGSYYSHVGQVQIFQPGDFGGDDGDFTTACDGEPCCEERNACRATARSNFFSNLAKYVAGGAVAGAGSGAKLSTVIPATWGWGTVAMGIVGSIWGGSAGAIIAANIYHSDIEACNATYRACISRKTN